jgi:hypothetical protein
MWVHDAHPRWAFMIAAAYSIFVFFKWLTWRTAMKHAIETPKTRSLAYVFLWPGMDAAAFLDTKRRAAPPAAAEWFRALAKTVIGSVLLWVMARRVPAEQPALAGGVGIAGFLMLLHFGTFHLLSLAWRTAGIDARPIMNAPLRATGLSDFWSNRWNLGFRQLTHDFLLRPLRRGHRMGVTGLAMLPFLASGLVHDFVISVPAGGGYGLPTLYFLIQGLGVHLERSALGRAYGLDRGGRGWSFALVVVALPVSLLFHVPFRRNVMVPLLHAIGALPTEAL